MKNKEKISEIIGSRFCGITVKNILEKLDSKINKTTVYRNLEQLVNSGEILEDFSKSGEKNYSMKKTHHHHFICDKCGGSINIGCFINGKISNLEKEFGFKVTNHSFLLNGICKNCL